MESQFAVLEPPGLEENPIAVDVDLPAEEIVNAISSVLSPAALKPR